MEYKVGDIIIARSIHNENKEFIFDVTNIVLQDRVQLLYGKDVFSGKNVYAVHERYCKLYNRSISPTENVERLSELTKEEFHRMPQGLDKDSRHNWAKDTLQKINATEKEKKPIKSDGKSSSYYDVKLSQKTIDFINETGYIKTEHLIFDLFDNNFDYGTVLKSLVRSYGCLKGAGKAGNNFTYEMNKVEYYTQRVRDNYEGQVGGDD